MTSMLIDSIVVDRQLRPDDNVEDLAKSILDQGLQFPVVIREDRYLVDGLRRLEASRLAGCTTIDVVVARTFEDVTDALAASHADTPLGRKDYPPWRLNELWRSTIKLPHRHRGGPNEHPSRMLMKEALHLSSDNLMQSTIYTYRIAEQPGPMGDVAREAVKLMEAGVINGYGGRIRVYAYKEAQLSIDPDMTKTKAQRLITQAAANILGTAKGLQLVPPGLEAEAFDSREARQLGYQLEEARRIIVAMAGKLKKIYRSEETDK